MSTKIVLIIGVLLFLSAVVAGVIVFTVRMNDVMPSIAQTAEANTLVTIVTATPIPTQRPYPSVTPFNQ